MSNSPETAQVSYREWAAQKARGSSSYTNFGIYLAGWEAAFREAEAGSATRRIDPTLHNRLAELRKERDNALEEIEVMRTADPEELAAQLIEAKKEIESLKRTAETLQMRAETESLKQKACSGTAWDPSPEEVKAFLGWTPEKGFPAVDDAEEIDDAIRNVIAAQPEPPCGGRVPHLYPQPPEHFYCKLPRTRFTPIETHPDPPVEGGYSGQPEPSEYFSFIRKDLEL